MRVVRRWKQFGPESSGKEMYLRRHYAETVMDDGATWVVYCLRQPHGPGGAGGRWFVYSIAAAEGPGASMCKDGSGSPGSDPDGMPPTSS
jgi:hypothetical protein